MKKGLILLGILLLWAGTSWAQSLSIEYGPASIPIDQYFTISVKVSPTKPVKVEGFPEIEGLQKSTRQLSSSTYKTGQQITVVYTLTQRYAPLKEGEVTVKPFTLTVDGKTVTAKPYKLKVGPPQPVKPVTDTLPTAPLVAPAPEFVEVKENAFLTLHVPKKQAYVGESVPVSLWFYVADTDLGLLDFYQFETQILEVVRQLKQRSVWEEVLEQQEIQPEKIKVGDKAFTRYKLHEAVLFPITAQALRFPVVQLQMVKYKVAKNPSLLTQNRLPEYKSYATSAQTVEVRALPPHPLRDQVPVGVFRLQEQLSRNTISINQNSVYQFRVEGEGNIGNMPTPQTIWDSSGIEIYPPEVRQYVNAANSKISGTKTYRYFVVGRHPGEYPLRSIFQWVYFNPVTARYDTLKPSMTIRVRGKEDQNATIRSQDVGSFYDIISDESNQVARLDQMQEARRYSNIALAVLLVVALFIFIKKNS
ncbi:BatD family protein [Rufibacter sp. DG15C]|uniref:BatD family protein n=1 Tax=Rufibacter sp. DG15C TaxID=1379909 RepID=UPI0018D32A8C|nr:BatD family protein [Rufibacter sp. DG15C]